MIQPASVVALVAVALYARYQVLTRMVGRVEVDDAYLGAGLFNSMTLTDHN